MSANSGFARFTSVARAGIDLIRAWRDLGFWTHLRHRPTPAVIQSRTPLTTLGAQGEWA
jgi:hypothetical protein